MWHQDDFKQGVKAYGTGFGWGVLIGIFSWLVIGKAVLALPVLLGMTLGAVAFQLKIRQLKKQRHDH